MTIIISQLHSLPWTEAFNRNALAKARVYAIEDRIKIHLVDDEMIEATCAGSESHVYQQVIYLVKDEQERFGLRCFCACQWKSTASTALRCSFTCRIARLKRLTVMPRFS
jgi:hypothetical protein